MNRTELLTERYVTCPSSQREYEANGKKYTVTRIFTGGKDINKIIFELAVSRADRETGMV